MIKISYLITGLCAGGAELMLFNLLSRLDRSTFRAEVISMLPSGPVGEKISGLGIPVRSLELRRDLPNPLGALRLARWLREDPPDVIQTWMYHANFLGSLVAPIAAGAPVIWGIRHGNLVPGLERRRTIGIARACALMSHWLPAKIICCSEASRKEHIRLGYAAEKMAVVPNGFDVGAFRPDAADRYSVRRELGIEENAPLIGLAARFHPQKDHHNFLKAASVLHGDFPETHFVLCGRGVTWENQQLSSWVAEAGLNGCCHLLGPRDDMPRLFAAMDIAASSSVGEGFSVAIGEAMASGVPCVVTDVGDSALLVGDTGLVVPARNPSRLAASWATVLRMPIERRTELGQRARARVLNDFELSRIADRYHTIYMEVQKGRGRDHVRKWLVRAKTRINAKPTLIGSKQNDRAE